MRTDLENGLLALLSEDYNGEDDWGKVFAVLTRGEFADYDAEGLGVSAEEYDALAEAFAAWEAILFWQTDQGIIDYHGDTVDAILAIAASWAADYEAWCEADNLDTYSHM